MSMSDSKPEGAAGDAAAAGNVQSPRGRWTVEQAQAWHQKHPWLVGCNYIPGTAVNQLEMWQEETWDPETVERELAWAAGLGFNSARVYLHDIPWALDPSGFSDRMEAFLRIAARHGIGAVFVMFDAVWDPFPRPGPQRAPRPRVHNSGWVQGPGAEILGDPARHDHLKDYVQGVIGRFGRDSRVHAWDLFNEPDNPVGQYADRELANKAEMALELIQKTFAWARGTGPAQPLTSGVWIVHGEWEAEERLSPMEKFQLGESDVVSFHHYGELEQVRRCLNNLRRHNRPILCTEYMARTLGSTFDPVLGFLKEEKVGAFNWGLVDGKTQTIYPWDSWERSYGDEPETWFHDIFRADGTPYDPEEVRYIQKLTGARGQFPGRKDGQAGGNPTSRPF